MKNFKLVALMVIASLCGQQAVAQDRFGNAAEREAVKAALARIANKKIDNTYEHGMWVGINKKNGQYGLRVGEGVDLRGLEIHSIAGAQFQNASFGHGVLLGHSNLPGADFTQASLHKTNLNDSNLRYAKLLNTTIQDVYFTKSDLSNSEWRGATLTGGQNSFEGTNLADMDGLQYPETTIHSDVSFRGALNMPFEQRCAAQQKGALGITYSFLENFKRCPNLQLRKKEKAVTPVPAPESIQEARERDWQRSGVKKLVDSLRQYRL